MIQISIKAQLTYVKQAVLLLLTILAVSGLQGEAVAASAENYRIQPQTKLKVNIVEWISATGEYKEWTALNGEYIVSSTGEISIPLIGELQILDKTTDAVETLIADALKRKTGLAVVPVASVEVSRYPMIYVTGAVDRSGELEFRPQMTVMQAVAMAGGRERRQIATGGYSEADQVRYFGELNRYQLVLKQLVARRARLQAELDESDAIVVPGEISATAPADKRIMDNENMLFVARTQALHHQLAALADLGQLLKGEIEVLDEKKVVQERQIKIAQDALAVVSRLVNSKALAKTSEASSERLVADLTSSMLDLVVASMRAKQKLSETDRDTLTLKGQHRIEAGRDLQTVQADIDDTKLKRDTTLQVLQITGASLSHVNDMKSVELQPMEYWITRQGGDGAALQATASTSLQPGDVLEVRLGLTSDTENPIPVGVRQTQ